MSVNILRQFQCKGHVFALTPFLTLTARALEKPQDSETSCSYHEIIPPEEQQDLQNWIRPGTCIVLSDSTSIHTHRRCETWTLHSHHFKQLSVQSVLISDLSASSSLFISSDHCHTVGMREERHPQEELCRRLKSWSENCLKDHFHQDMRTRHRLETVLIYKGNKQQLGRQRN
ncbi:hypothetical protein MHYP_G00167690 [Metynnis hypsauchen]